MLIDFVWLSKNNNNVVVIIRTDDIVGRVNIVDDVASSHTIHKKKTLSCIAIFLPFPSSLLCCNFSQARSWSRSRRRQMQSVKNSIEKFGLPLSTSVSSSKLMHIKKCDEKDDDLVTHSKIAQHTKTNHKENERDVQSARKKKRNNSGENLVTCDENPIFSAETEAVRADLVR